MIAQLREQSNRYLPAILITATTDENMEQKTDDADVGYLRKLVKPASLRAMMSALLAQKLQANYSLDE